MTKTLLLNLPKDLGDCALASPAIRATLAWCKEKNIDCRALGSERSQAWVETLADVTLHRITNDEAAQLDAVMFLNLNFYDHDTAEKFCPHVPLYQPEKMEVVAEDRADFGAGAVIGKKHVSALINDCLHEAGILAVGVDLPPASLPAQMTDDLAVLRTQVKFAVIGDYAVLIPVCAANRPLKRWATENFVAVAKNLIDQNIAPVLIGGPSAEEKALCAEIAAATGYKTVNLCGRTSVDEIAALAKGALFTLGNDTGPTHIAAISGAPTFSLFGYYSDPATFAPLHPMAKVISAERVAAITPEAVQQQIPIRKSEGKKVTKKNTI